MAKLKPLKCRNMCKRHRLKISKRWLQGIWGLCRISPTERKSRSKHGRGSMKKVWNKWRKFQCSWITWWTCIDKRIFSRDKSSMRMNTTKKYWSDISSRKEVKKSEKRVYYIASIPWTIPTFINTSMEPKASPWSSNLRKGSCSELITQEKSSRRRYWINLHSSSPFQTTLHTL